MVKHSAHDTDTGNARSRLIAAALKLFAEKGYKAASTRDICEAAEANISAIRYYFGDKAGLYRAAFIEPMGEQSCMLSVDSFEGMFLREALNRLFKDFLAPMKKSEELKLVVKLHYREMLEPTGAWQEVIDAEIKPQHAALVSLFKQHFGLSAIDEDLHRLAFAVIGMAVHYYVGQDVVMNISPQIMQTEEAVDILIDRLTGYAVSMVEGEAARRAGLEAGNAG